MIDKRRVIRVVAVLTVALAAGHLVQTMAVGKAKPVVAGEARPEPQSIVTLTADAEIASKPATPQAMIQPLPSTPELALPMAPVAASMVSEPVYPALPVLPAPVFSDAAVATAEVACPVTFELMSEPSAMIGVTLLAPCRENERVVLKHAGLAITGQTTATGALFTALPALDATGAVEVLFHDGETATAAIAMPEVVALRRFGVQWQADDSFQIHAFEAGAGYGGTGHVSAADPHRPMPGVSAIGGFLTLLGDPASPLPLLAEIYSFPVDPAAKAEVVVEAAVTAKTCGRELLAETISSAGGRVDMGDLTLVMPECDGIGDYLVLNNLAPSLTIAASN